ncbi:cytochrome P450 [Daedaleopsis nitida]|nr:cytochrome P450 [Daedaleopsis nitida]
MSTQTSHGQTRGPDAYSSTRCPMLIPVDADSEMRGASESKDQRKVLAGLIKSDIGGCCSLSQGSKPRDLLPPAIGVRSPALDLRFPQLAIGIVLLTYAIAFSLKSRLSSDARRLPPGPQPLPVIGNVLDMPRNDLGRDLRNLTKTYGVYLSVLGKHVVLGSYRAACDLLIKRSSNYSGRPKSVMASLCSFAEWNFFVFDYGQEWRLHRRVFHQHMNSVIGRYFSVVERGATIGEKVSVPGRFIPGSLPYLRFFPSCFPGGSFKKYAAEARRDLLHNVSYLLTHHDQGSIKESFVSRMLEDIAPEGKERAAALETNAAIRALLLAMKLYPEVQRKAQVADLDAVVGSGRLPEFEDRNSLPYVRAIVKKLLPLTLVKIPYRTPDRFLDKDGKFDIEDRDPARFMFGFRRRLARDAESVPGRYFAEATLFIMCASLL